jgi:GNAT superfamily N-acetyltransferase
MEDGDRVEVRRLTPADLVPFQAGMPAWNTTEYAKRLAFQQRGLAVQLVAWVGDEPAGKAMVVFPGHPEWSPSAYREGCPEIRDLGVAAAWRRRGIATALVAAAEREARSAGFARLGWGLASRTTPPRRAPSTGGSGTCSRTDRSCRLPGSRRAKGWHFPWQACARTS